MTGRMYTVSSLENVEGKFRRQETASQIVDIKKGFTDHGGSEHVDI